MLLSTSIYSLLFLLTRVSPFLSFNGLIPFQAISISLTRSLLFLFSLCLCLCLCLSLSISLSVFVSLSLSLSLSLSIYLSIYLLVCLFLSNLSRYFFLPVLICPLQHFFLFSLPMFLSLSLFALSPPHRSVLLHLSFSLSLSLSLSLFLSLTLSLSLSLSPLSLSLSLSLLYVSPLMILTSY